MRVTIPILLRDREVCFRLHYTRYFLERQMRLERIFSAPFTVLYLEDRSGYRRIFADEVGFEPTMEITLTRLTVWTVRPTTAIRQF